METYKVSNLQMKAINYYSLYFLKALGVIFVLMIHFHGYKSQYLEPLYRCGVPIFYIISGFFLYVDNKDKQKDRIKKSMLKIVRLILFFNIVYYLLYWFTDGKSKIDNVEGIVRLFVYGDSVSGHLWFLTSYLWTLIFFFLCKRFNVKDKIMYIIALVYLIEGLAEGQYSFVVFGDDSSFSIQQYYLPWLNCSLTMMIVGYAVKKNEQQIVGYMRKYAKMMFVGTIVLCLLPYVEHRLLSMTHHYSAAFMTTTFSAVIAMFLYCVCNPQFGGNSFAITIGKEHSGNIYYWQFFPYSLFVMPVLTENITRNWELPIMFIVLLVWSHGVNFVMSKLKRYEIV